VLLEIACPAPWDQVVINKILPSPDVNPERVEFMESGAAEFGIVSASSLRHPARASLERQPILPLKSQPPLFQGEIPTQRVIHGAAPLSRIPLREAGPGDFQEERVRTGFV
jgi:hypothetical protein